MAAETQLQTPATPPPPPIPLTEEQIASFLVATCSYQLPPIGPNGELPTEFPIWKIGAPGELNVEAEYPSGTDKPNIQRYCVDQTSIDWIVGNWKRRGIELMGDYEHQSLNDQLVGPIPASIQSFELVVKDGFLCATKVVWTDEAGALVRSGKYRYFSPAFDWDRASNRVRMLINIALTNNPATNQIRPLVAANKTRWIDPKLKIDTADYPIRRSATSTTEATTMPGEIAKAGLSKLGEAISQHMARNGIEPEKLARHLGLSTDSLHTMMHGGPDKLEPEHHKCMSKLAEHMDMPVHHLRALAMDETGNEDEEEEKRKAKAKAQADLDKEVAKLSATANKVPALEAEVARLKGITDSLAGQNKTRAIASLLVANEKRLFTPDLLAMAKAHGEEFGVEALEKMLKALPEGGPLTIKPANGDGANLADPVGDDVALAGLTKADANVAALVGNDLKELATFKSGDFSQLRPDPTKPGKLAFPRTVSGAKFDTNHLGAAAAVNNALSK